MGDRPMASLSSIPVMEEPCTIRDIFNAHRDIAATLAHNCQPFQPLRSILNYLDRRSQEWLARVRPPYMEDLHYVAGQMPGENMYALNLSYEWACTTVAKDDPAGGVNLFRTMDWMTPGMGSGIVVANQEGPAGRFWNAAYPGFAGVLTGMAPGRFAITINHAPVPKRGYGPVIDWFMDKRDNFSKDGMPPPLLLRQVFEECANYDEAVARLSQTPLMTQAIYTVTGVEHGEHCIIEREYDEAIVHKDAPLSAGNHWLNDEWKGWPRPIRSRDRQAAMIRDYDSIRGDFDWLRPPVLNLGTRMAFEANAATGEMKVAGYEGTKIVTRVLTIKPSL